MVKTGESDSPSALGALTDEVETPVGSGQRRMHGALGKHQPATGPQGITLRPDAEGDLALDHPQALVVIVRVGLVVGRRVVAPAEDLEAFGFQPLAQRSFARLTGLAPADDLELHSTASLRFAKTIGKR